MMSSVRSRFVVWSTVSYLILAVIWILVSDELLTSLMDVKTIIFFSTVKGILFILATTAYLFVCLRVVISIGQNRQSNILDTLTENLSISDHLPWLDYLFAIFISAGMLIIRQKIAADFDFRPLLILFIFPIIMSALFGGLGPGLVATAVSALGIDYLAIPPLHSFRIQYPGDLLQWLFLVINGVLISFLSDFLRRSIVKANNHRDLLDAVISGTSDAVYVKDIQGKYLLINNAGAEFIGKDISQILGNDDTLLLAENNVRQLKIRDASIVEEGNVISYEESVTNLDGKTRVFLITKGPVFDPMGQIKGVFGVARDITERKNAEDILRASEHALKTVQRLAAVGSWEWDLQSGNILWSAETYRIFGLEPDMNPANFSEIEDYFTPDSWSALSGKLQALIKTGTPCESDAELILADGTHKWIIVRGEGIAAPSGHIVKLHGSVQDITQRKHSSFLLQQSEERLRLVIKATSDGIWDWDLMTNKVYRSQRFFEMCGYDENHEFSFLEQITYPEDLPYVLQHVELHKLGFIPEIDIEYRLMCKNGDTLWIRDRGAATHRDDEGNALRIVGAIADINERKLLELEQKEASTVFSNSFEGIMVVSIDKLITKVNPSFSRITGYTEAEVKGKSTKMLSSGRHDASFYQAIWKSINTKGLWRGELWNRRKNGEVYAELLTISAVRDSRGEIKHYLGVFSDISERKTHEEELDRIAHYDPLTGTPNRLLLADRFEQSILRSNRLHKSLAVCFVDIDGFKTINDLYGHAVGDQLLIGFSNNLRHTLRAEDTLARLGGDEFVLLLSDISSPSECSAILERLLASINRPIVIGDLSLSVTASIGVSMYPDDNVDADTLLRHADHAMYQAKESGKKHYHFFDSENDKRLKLHREFVDRIKLAFEHNELRLFYQPKVNLLTGEVAGVEALVRWQHPDKGILSPAEFLPYINGSRLEFQLGEWVINTALAQATAWLHAGMKTSISVNISAHHLLNPDFFEFLKTSLDNFPEVNPARFELEVLETAAISDIEQAVSILESCRTLGVHFSLDDFGTGYSSLTYLRRLPLNTLKVDQSFVRKMLIDTEDLGIVESVIRLGHAFNLEVIAEGVETLEHGSMLLKLGCQLAQGYGIARPMPAEHFIAWSEQWHNQAIWKTL